MEKIPTKDFKILFESSPGLFLVLAPNPSFTILGASDAYLKATMTTRDAVIGRGIFDVFPDNPADPDATGVANLRASLERVVARQAMDTMAVQKYDIPRPAAAGGGFEDRYWSPCNTPVFSADGRLAYIIHRVEDVTDYVQLRQASQRQQAQAKHLAARNQEMEAEILHRNRDLSTLNKEMHRANQTLAELADQIRQESDRKDEFLAMLSHELRNPLASIHNAARLLEKGRGCDGDAQSAIRILRRQARHLSSLVDDLLDVSRITRGLVELKCERVDLIAVVSRALETAHPLFDEKRHNVSLSVPQDPVWVNGDPVRLEQVLLNLLNNAAKYTNTGGHISISLERRDASAEVHVRDDGIGLGPELLSRIFDLFQQDERGLARSEGGLGIGLTIVERLVEMHGGWVSAISAGEDKGSEFIVGLPLAPGQAPGPVPERTAPPDTAGSKRVLVVDDDRDAAESLAMLLELSGHKVSVVHDGASALAKLKEIAPDVILLDIGLPGMSGYELAKQLRRDPSGRKVPIAAVSGYGQESDRERAYAAGCDEHFVKPVDIAVLEAFVDGAQPSPRKPE